MCHIHLFDVFEAVKKFFFGDEQDSDPPVRLIKNFFFSSKIAFNFCLNFFGSKAIFFSFKDLNTR